MNDILAMPKLGIYVSKTNPSIRISVTDVDIADDEDDSPGSELQYFVSFVEGEDENDMSALVFELDQSEWQDFVRSEQLEYDRDPYLDSIPENSPIAKIRDLLMQAKKNDRS